MIMSAIQQIPTPPVTPGLMHDATAIIMMFALLGAVILILWPLARALARRLEGGGSSVQGEVEALRSRVDQLEQGQGRLAELEERIDFAERMLAQAREPDRLQR